MSYFYLDTQQYLFMYLSTNLDFDFRVFVFIHFQNFADDFEFVLTVVLEILVYYCSLVGGWM